MISVSLIAKLEHVRAASGPLDITSGYRCPEYQELLTKDPSVETVLQSQHTLGHAADIRLANSSATLFQFSNLLQECGKYFLAIGQGRRFLHVDERVDKVRRWYYSYWKVNLKWQMIKN